MSERLFDLKRKELNYMFNSIKNKNVEMANDVESIISSYNKMDDLLYKLNIERVFPEDNEVVGQWNGKDLTYADYRKLFETI